MRSQLAAMFLVFSLSANAQTLSGAIDMHTHSDPDGVPRKNDAIDLARRCALATVTMTTLTSRGDGR